MGKIGLVIAREYWTRVKKRSFIIMTFLGPVLFGGLMIGAIFIGLQDDSNHLVRVYDVEEIISDNGVVDPAYRQFFEDTDKLHYQFATDTISASTFLESQFTISIKFTGDVLNGSRHTSLIYKKLPSINVREDIRSSLRKALEVRKVKDLNIDYETYKRAKVEISFDEYKITEESGQEKSIQQEAAIVGFVFAIIIYMFIFLYGVQVMRGVIEEKTNRIVEVIISSIKPFELMMGKVIGIGLVGLTQFLMWVVLSSIIFLVVQLSFADMLFDVVATTDGVKIPQDFGKGDEAIQKIFEIAGMLPWPLIIGSFIFYFVGGFLMYGSLFAAVGAAVDSETDTQQFILPISLPLIFGFIVAEFMLQNPEGAIGNIFAVFPLTSPVVNMVKVPLGFDPAIQIPSMILLVLAFIGTVWLAGKIYRTGILMYGKKASYKELWKWLFYKN
jgi:ABC-2 type transport system permease protein